MNKYKKQSGSVLMLSMMLVIVVAAVVAAAHFATSGQALMTSRSADIDALECTAEGLLDYAYASWKTAMLSGTTTKLTATQATALVSGANRPQLPGKMEIVSFIISPVDAYGKPVEDGVPVPTITTDPPGWRADSYPYMAQVTLRSTGLGGERRVTLKSEMGNDLIPPARGVFYTEGDFELYRPAPMIIDGNVHTNKDAHVSTQYSPASSGLSFLDTANVSYVGKFDSLPPTGATSWSGYGGTDNAAYYARGASSQVKQTEAIESIGLGTTTAFNTTDTNPNNDGNREMIEPPVAGYTDPEAIANSRIYNNAGLIVNVTGPLNPTGGVAAIGNNTFTGQNVTIKAQKGTALTQTQANAILSSLSNSTYQDTQTWQANWVAVTSQVWVSNWVQVSTQVWVSNWKQVDTQVWVEGGHYNDKGNWTSKSGYVTVTTWEDKGAYQTQTNWVDQGGYQNQTTYVDQGKWVTERVYTQTTLYDKRETRDIPITTMNLGTMNSTLNTLSGFNSILYVYDSGSSATRGIRVTNGGVLPNNGLTIASENGVYLQGDFNTGTTTNPNSVPSNNGGNSGGTANTYVSGYSLKPSAIAADSVMILSNNWSDSNASKSLSYRSASNTTVNTAIVAGYQASVAGTVGGRPGYSGGMNNFPRFLESWSGNYMTFNGAFVQLYESAKFTGRWDTGDIYSPPYRVWKFNQLLLDTVLPGIPPASTFGRGARRVQKVL